MPSTPLEHIQNFSTNFSGVSYRVVSPKTVAEVCEIVKEARERKEQVHVVSKAHSYNDVFFTPQRLISLEHFKHISFNKLDKRVSCGAGVTIDELSAYLDRQGFTLPFAGSYGGQTVVGALSTGTHGYYRGGGGLGECVQKVSLVDGLGKAQMVSDEKELSAFRCNLGTLGIITQIEMEVQEKDVVRYQIVSLGIKEFFGRYKELVAIHDHVRFVISPFSEKIVMAVLIDHIASAKCPLTKGAAYLSDRDFPTLLLNLSRWVFKRKIVHGIVKLVQSISSVAIDITVPFSSYIFTRNGVVAQNIFLSQLLHAVFNDPDCLNMSLAIDPSELEGFYDVFFEHRDRYPQLTDANFSMRYMGGSDKVLLGTNYLKDVIVVDVQVSKKNPCSLPFLNELEEKAVSRFRARPHWGKVFFSEKNTMEKVWPRESIQLFKKVKKKYDPDCLFTNPYTVRVLGI
ncbi:MAG: L-gulono-1,4-lactone dehydrogenase [Microgenomates bacterium OLB22]|nr:MAG: L-gulono-1,4-lactone dehydrogenase [Microgenomates bacterium OLB22]